MFERSLSSLIKGLRANAVPLSGATRQQQRNEARYVSQQLDEIRVEMRSEDRAVKAEAVLKLCYLQMLGHTSSAPNSFNMLEVMSSQKLHEKQIGYLGASMSFTPETDVRVLVTNLMQKDLHSNNPIEVSIALNGLSHLASAELVPHLLTDVLSILQDSPLPALRKRALLSLHALIAHDETSSTLVTSLPALQKALHDADSGVVGAAVNVITELSHARPEAFLEYAPDLCSLLETHTNNWTLIKLLKLLGTLAAESNSDELAALLASRLESFIRTTKAMSLLYEALVCAIEAGLVDGEDRPAASSTSASSPDAFRTLCLSRLTSMQSGTDANLRVMAHSALRKLENRSMAPRRKKLPTNVEGMLIEFGETDKELLEIAGEPARGADRSTSAAIAAGKQPPNIPVASLLDDDDPEQVESFALHSQGR
ncbi:Vesicle coat complex AP-3, delta subunit [Ceraceosorus bombacis]|uniref:Vesicle coat complex AP-3, delta subunit n=1 Tax=Ceraceosorus bombacis TaxID=401625 RepID=A0A0P1BNJ1_9BASI|nr:Vesicle coat complex AP-3, delta subunit [Ceraceosorus bombacis]